jgi:hypothetical protein
MYCRKVGAAHLQTTGRARVRERIAHKTADLSIVSEPSGNNSEQHENNLAALLLGRPQLDVPKSLTGRLLYSNFPNEKLIRGTDAIEPKIPPPLAHKVSI